ncbi:MAG: hypothetical protein P1U50_01205 [Parvibaculaceae bacterium]|nr:hypothetical protein [Parvibaculaceae bacterium]
MISKLVKLAGGGSTLWIYGAVLVFGVSLGGYGVHKLYQASQVGQLKAEISRIERQADERVLLAQEAAGRAMARANQTSTTIKEVKVYVPSNPACSLGLDALRLLNRGRQ